MRQKMESVKRKLYSENPFYRVVAACLGGLILILILLYVRHSLCYVSTDDAFIESHVIPISPKVSAHVRKVLVDDNQEVKTGALLIELDDSDFKVRYDMAKAQLEAAQASSDQSRRDVERYKKLEAHDEISKQQLDLSQLKVQTSAARLDAAKARVQQSELLLSYTKIFSPIAGHVTRKSVEEGAFVQTGQALMAIVPEEKWVIANFKETQLTHMRAGQKVEIKIDTYPQKTFKGHVDSVQRGTGARFSLLPPENATGNYVKVVQRIPVKIVFDEPSSKEYPLAAGMSVVPEVKVRG